MNEFNNFFLNKQYIIFQRLIRSIKLVELNKIIICISIKKELLKLKDFVKKLFRNKVNIIYERQLQRILLNDSVMWEKGKRFYV